MKIVNQSRNTIVASEATKADTFLSRMIGLLNRKDLSAQEALIITKCNSIHMLFMKFSIDVIFITKENIVVGLIKGIQPFRLSPVFWKASCAIELAVGGIERSNTSLGDRLSIL
ncbi:MAG: DUF192 domain-containing protein [Candidatus Omnitrophica bacterium]|nr:DUF192 domain-containing protein [Candidatus Omnitrophota bacterium]MCB9747081.1 DUF192 domain-containing protein [Candidatus Omnitrophota bacterium]